MTQYMENLKFQKLKYLEPCSLETVPLYLVSILFDLLAVILKDLELGSF